VTIARPLIVTPSATALIAGLGDRPAELLVPSPEMSMMRRLLCGFAATKRSIAKSMAPLIEVRPIKDACGEDRGAIVPDLRRRGSRPNR